MLDTLDNKQAVEAKELTGVFLWIYGWFLWMSRKSYGKEYSFTTKQHILYFTFSIFIILSIILISVSIYSLIKYFR